MNLARRFVNALRLTRAALAALALALCARADEWAPNLTANAVWQSNATHADRSVDQIDSVEATADVLAAQRYAFGRDDALILSGHLAASWWPRYNGLMNGAAGGRAEWRHQFGPGPLAPVLSLEGGADAVAAKETGQRGVSSTVTLAARKRFNAATRLTLSQEFALFDARYKPYDRASGTTALELDRDLNRTTRLTFGARFRDGDVLTYASGSRPDLEALAPNRIETSTFDRPLTAYRVDARTWSGRIALVRALDDTSALVLAYEWSRSERQPLRFVNHLASVGFVHQF